MKHSPAPWSLDIEGAAILDADGKRILIVDMKSKFANIRLAVFAPKMYDYIKSRAVYGDDNALALLKEIEP